MVGVNGLMADQYEAKTPHRIELCEKALSRPTRNYGKRRIMTGVQTENTTLHPKPEMTKIETRSKPLKINNCISTKSNGRSARSRVTRKVSRTDEYHKVTDYFNTVKDVPKSPPPPTIEKPANLEPTITNGKCTYKLDSTISNRRNSQANITQYFPVRRSERKTSKLMLAEKMRDLEKAIREQREDGLEVAEFKGKGRGVIATRAFRRGEFVAEYAGELVGVQEARERETRYAEDPMAGCYMYYFRLQEQSYCVDATAESGRVGRLVNHSRTGNLLTKAVWVDGPRLVLLAAHDIAPGEELTYDYGDRSKESLRHHPWLAL